MEQINSNININNNFNSSIVNDGISATELLTKFRNGEISYEVFLKEFGKAEVYYSTPFGDHKDGGQKVFLLAGPNNTGYHPAFTSTERLIEFYQNAGRINFMAMKGTFSSVLATTKNMNGMAPVKMGIMIDPGYFNVYIDVDMLDSVIEIMNK